MATISISVSSATDVNALIDNAGGGFGSSNRGWFEGTMLLPHDSYGFQSGANSSAFVAEGNLTYNPIPGFPNSHMVEGDLDSVTIGTGLNNGTGTGYAGSNTLATSPLTISGLDITGSTGSGGLAHTITMGLANGVETAFNNYVFEDAGNDIVFTGSTGADAISAGLGADTFTGDSGADIFRFADAAHADFDTITDFATGTDKIDLGFAANWDAALNSAGDVFYDSVNGLLKGRDANNVAFEIATDTVVFADII